MSDKDTKAQPTVNEGVKTLADKFQETITKASTDKENLDSSLYLSNLPEGITEEVDTAVREYRQNFLHATGLAYGRAMVDIAAKDKKVEQASITVGMGGKDAVEHHFKRKEEFVNRMDKDNPVTVTKHGYLSTKLTVSGTSGSSGQLGAVRKTIGALAAEKLAK